MHRLTTTVLALALTGILLGCTPALSTQTVAGETVMFNGAVVRTSAQLNQSGMVQSVSVTLPYAVVTNAPVAHDMTAPPVIAAVAFPAAVRAQTFFNHFEVDWMPMGHEPVRYGTPHFDFHFYSVDPAAVSAVDCRNATQPEMSRVPSGWLPPVPPGTPDPTSMCVPHMGYHALPRTEFKAPGVLQDGMFDQVMITGFYGGKLTFIEPMVTQAALARKTDFTLPVPQPTGLGRESLFPTTFDARYNASSETYTLTFAGFKTLQ